MFSKYSKIIPKKARSARASRTRFIPLVGGLESRTVMSTLTVTSVYDSGPGTLRATINSASNGDKIVFSPALDGGTIGLVNPIDYSTSLDIEGPGATRLTISGGNYSQLLEAYGATTDETIAGLTLSSGYGNSGSAFSGDLDAVAFTNCVFNGNVAQTPDFEGTAEGGAVQVIGNTLTIQGCTFTGNGASGTYLQDGTAYGGAVFADVQNLTVTKSTFTNNHAVGSQGHAQAGLAFGGALYSSPENNESGPQGPSVTLSGDTFSSNLALTGNATEVGANAGLAEGGGVDIDAGFTQGLTVSLTSNKFNSNEAEGSYGTFAGVAEGGNLYLGADFASSPTFTVSGNQFVGGLALGGTVSLNNSGDDLGVGGAAYGGNIALDAFLSSNASFILSSNQVSNGRAQGGAGGDPINANVLPGIGGDARGGGIYADADLASSPRFIISATTLTYNSAVAGGDAAYAGASSNDAAVAAGGGYDASAGDSAAPYFTLDGSTVAFNTVTGGAGGSVTSSSIGQGDEGGDAFGGGVTLDPGDSAGATYTITRDTFNANTATAGLGGSSGYYGNGANAYSGGDGGYTFGGGLAIVPGIESSNLDGTGLAVGLKITVGRSSFANNRAIGGAGGAGGYAFFGGNGGFGVEGRGGGIGIFGYYLDPSSTITLDTDTLTGNSALGGKGGAGGNGIFDGGTGASGGGGLGGGLFVETPATVNILHGLMTRNTAGGGAGGAGGTGAADNGTTGQAGQGYGGGAYIDTLSVFATVNTRILMNVADNYPDIYGTITFH